MSGGDLMNFMQVCSLFISKYSTHNSVDYFYVTCNFTSLQVDPL